MIVDILVCNGMAVIITNQEIFTWYVHQYVDRDKITEFEKFSWSLSDGCCVRCGQPTRDTNSSRAPGPTSSLLGVRRCSIWCSILGVVGDPLLSYKDTDSGMEKDPIKTSGLPYFDIASTEKKWCQSKDDRSFFAGIWKRKDSNKGKFTNTDEVVKNDIFKDDIEDFDPVEDEVIENDIFKGETDYPDDSELIKNFIKKLEIKKNKPENYEREVVTSQKGVLPSGRHEKEIDSAISKFEDEQFERDAYNRRNPVRQNVKEDMYNNHGQEDTYYTNNFPSVLHKEESYSECLDETLYTDGEEVGCLDKGYLEEKPSELECNHDEPKQAASDSSITRESSNDEEPLAEEELKFREMMATFDKFYPDDNDSMTLYELVIKQGFKTRTRELFDAMQEFASSNGFKIKDGAPNGNCMFHAVNDQLIINGDFRFNEMSLRRKAVAYLKHHPKNKDEIPLECFLINEETWDAYLKRMSKSKEWGDHLIIKALCEVLHRKIVVHTVQSAERLNHYEFMPEDSDTSCKEDLHLGHLGELHYLSLRPSNWKQSWLSKKEDPNEMALECYGFDKISKLFMPMFSILQMDLVLLSEVTLLQVPSRITSRNDGHRVETAGGRSDGTEIFYRQKDPSLDRAECYRRTESECPHMIMVCDHRQVIFDTKLPDQENFAYVETTNCHPGYCRLLYQYKGQRLFLHGWNVVPQLDPNSTVAKRSASGYRCQKWPPTAKEWLTRKTITNWPKMSLKNAISEAGCLVIQRSHPASPVPEIEWLFLFNNAEKKLMANLQWHKRSYYTFKIAVDFFTKNLKVRLHTVHLKSIFFFACEEIQERDFREFPGYCFLFMIQRLLNHLNNGYLPNYFIKENNMIDHFADQEICRIKEMVELIRVFPLQCLSFLLEEHGHFRSWIIDLLNCKSEEKIDLDEYTRCRIVQIAERETGANSLFSQLPTKKVKDFMLGEDIAGFGEEPIPDEYAGDDYYEAWYLNSLGVSLHNTDRNYEDASKYYFSAIDHLEKSSEKLSNEINLGGADNNQAKLYQRILEYDELTFTCFQNLSRCILNEEMKEFLKVRMAHLEKICARSLGEENIDFVKRLWDRLKYQE
ncbi:hypothetical protein FSP39_023047 [Pinctada imbricata]|uniref:OTU domain-containing protein n=1 Tax=Pinctada imbricata TaxID=66713 RepID=A0AA88YEW5_PINIB|nr:hypothetical protein FSP39_023047 [Pinctada imbricata]